MEIRAIPNTDIRSWWPFVKTGLEKILTKSSEEWIPEDIYANCFCGNSLLWVLMDNSRPMGFWVVIPRGQTIHVWCAYTPYAGTLDIGMKLFCETAKSANMTKVTFESYRKGWDKVARKHGFQPRSWVKEL